MEHFKRVSSYERPRPHRIFPDLTPPETALIELALPQRDVTVWAYGERSHILTLLETVAIQAYLGAGAAALFVTTSAFLLSLLR